MFIHKPWQCSKNHLVLFIWWSRCHLKHSRGNSKQFYDSFENFNEVCFSLTTPQWIRICIHLIVFHQVWSVSKRSYFELVFSSIITFAQRLWTLTRRYICPISAKIDYKVFSVVIVCRQKMNHCLVRSTVVNASPYIYTSDIARIKIIRRIKSSELQTNWLTDDCCIG
jgi:hypothetical protein